MESYICKKFCSYYKPDKESQKCGTYDFLKRNLTRGEVVRIASRITNKYDLSEDKQIRELVCEKCSFRADECDFRQGVKNLPCGGYTIIEHLLKGECSSAFFNPLC